MKQVGHQQQRVGGGKLRVVAQLHACELVQRVEGEALHPGLGIQPLRWNPLIHLAWYALRTPVPVVMGIAQQPAVGIQQPVVHRPRINANAGERLAGALRALLRIASEPCFDRLP